MNINYDNVTNIGNIYILFKYIYLICVYIASPKRSHITVVIIERYANRFGWS